LNNLPSQLHTAGHVHYGGALTMYTAIFLTNKQSNN